MQPIALLLTVKNTSSVVKHALRAIGEKEKNSLQRRDRFLENDIKGRTICKGRWLLLVMARIGSRHARWGTVVKNYAGFNFAPQTEHLPSAVIFGCSATSCPHMPHFTKTSPPFPVHQILLVSFD